MTKQEINTTFALTFRVCEFSHIICARKDNGIMPLSIARNSIELEKICSSLREEYGDIDYWIIPSNKWTFSAPHTSLTGSKRIKVSSSSSGPRTDAISTGPKTGTDVPSSTVTRNPSVEVNIISSDDSKIPAPVSNGILSPDEVGKLASRRNPKSILKSTPSPTVSATTGATLSLQTTPNMPAYLSSSYESDEDSDDD